MLMFDKLKDRLSRLYHPSEGQQILSDILSKCIVFEIDNVAKYLYHDNDREDFPMESFPNIAPPFENMWFEFHPPETINSNGEVKPFMAGMGIKKLGILSMSQRLDKDDFQGWIMTGQMFIRYESGIAEFPKREMFAVNQDGTFNTTLFGEGKTSLAMYTTKSAIDARQDGGLGTLSELFPMFMALSFIHCKNVEMIESPHLGAYKRRDAGSPKVKYYVLKIEAMKQVLRAEGQSETHGIKHALHICRGHFKDYSKGGGLFGKYKGLYWWESHVRGDPSQGVVVKDYSVNLPTDTPT